MGWKDIPKIDAHIHIIPREVHDANPDSDDEFSYAKIETYLMMSEQYNIKRAVIMPFNDPMLMSMDFTADAVHRNLSGMCDGSGDLFRCFADIDVSSSPEDSAGSIRKAMSMTGFCGIKIHPENSGMDIDDGYNDTIAGCALAMGCPVAVHSYPPSDMEQDRSAHSAPERIGIWMSRHPGLKAIVCHLGGFQWEDAAGLDAYFDISAVLPDLAGRYGITETNRILRRFGTERLIFATDWPCSRSVEPARIMERYISILDQMDFTPEEMHMIAHGNMEKLMGWDPAG